MPVRSTSRQTLYSQQVINTANENSASINYANYTEPVVYIRVTAKAGTSPTLDLDVEMSDDNTNWHKKSDVTQISDPTVTFRADVVSVTNLGQYIRLNNPTAPGGSSTPTMTVDAFIILKN